MPMLVQLLIAMLCSVLKCQVGRLFSPNLLFTEPYLKFPSAPLGAPLTSGEHASQILIAHTR